MQPLFLTLSTQAEQHLADIYDYTADRWGLSQADRYISRLWGTFDHLCQTPDIGHTLSDLPSRYKAYPLGSHLVIYTIVPPSLHILAILHAAMDIKARLENLLQHERDH